MIVEKEFTMKKGGYRQSWRGDFWPATSFEGLEGGETRNFFQLFYKNQKLTYVADKKNTSLNFANISSTEDQIFMKLET